MGGTCAAANARVKGVRAASAAVDAKRNRRGTSSAWVWVAHARRFRGGRGSFRSLGVASRCTLDTSGECGASHSSSAASRRAIATVGISRILAATRSGRGQTGRSLHDGKGPDVPVGEDTAGGIQRRGDSALHARQVDRIPDVVPGQVEIGDPRARLRPVRSRADRIDEQRHRDLGVQLRALHVGCGEGEVLADLRAGDRSRAGCPRSSMAHSCWR